MSCKGCVFLQAASCDPNPDPLFFYLPRLLAICKINIEKVKTLFHKKNIKMKKYINSMILFYIFICFYLFIVKIFFIENKI